MKPTPELRMETECPFCGAKQESLQKEDVKEFSHHETYNLRCLACRKKFTEFEAINYTIYYCPHCGKECMRR